MKEHLLGIKYVGMENGKIPLENTGRGRDVSPELVIGNLSPDARTLAVTLEDLTHPIRNFTHWIIWNIPATDRIEGGIKAGKRVSFPDGACQGVAYGLHRYAGPKPPRGKTHVYRFTVYSLDCEIELSPSARKKDFLKKAEGHILQKGNVEGEFE